MNLIDLGVVIPDIHRPSTSKMASIMESVVGAYDKVWQLRGEFLSAQ